jgi:O-antigen/teichoic acid export membrane protein
MRTKVFLQNSFSTALLQVITMLTGFIIPRIMLTGYGSEINGLVTSITQFISYINLIEAGLAGAAVYALYKPVAEQDYNGVNSILTATKNFYYQIGIYFIILVICMAIVYPLFVTTSLLTKVEVGILVIILGGSSAINFFIMAKYRVILNATQKIYVISIATTCQVVLNTLIIVVLAFFKVDIIILKATALLSILLKSLILFIYVKKQYKFVNYNEVPNYKALSNRWDVLYLQVLGSIHTGAPVVIATLFTTLKTVSVYSIYNVVFAGLSGLLSIFISGLSSSFGDVIARREIKTLQKAYKEFEFSYYMIISWAFACAIILVMPFIKIYTSVINDAEYYFPSLGLLFTLNGILYNLKTPQGMLVISAGLYKETRLQTTIQGLIAIFSSVIFVQFWGLEGILVGMCLSNLYRTIDLLFFIPRNVTKLDVLPSLLRMIRVFIVIGLCYLPFIFIKLTPNNFVQWFFIAFIVAVYCTLVTIIINFYFERELFKSVLTRINGVKNIEKKIIKMYK